MNQTTQTDETAPSIKLFGRNEVLYQKYLSGSGLSPDSDIARCIATIEHERARADAAEKALADNEQFPGTMSRIHHALKNTEAELESTQVKNAELRAECEKLRSKVAEQAEAAVQVESVFAWMKTAFINSDDVQYLQGIGAAHHSCHGREEALFLMGKWGIEPESNEVSDD